MASRIAASLWSGRKDAKKVVIVPEPTINKFEVEPANNNN